MKKANFGQGVADAKKQRQRQSRSQLYLPFQIYLLGRQLSFPLQKLGTYQVLHSAGKRPQAVIQSFCFIHILTPQPCILNVCILSGVKFIIVTWYSLISAWLVFFWEQRKGSPRCQLYPLMQLTSFSKLTVHHYKQTGTLSKPASSHLFYDPYWIARAARDSQ